MTEICDINLCTGCAACASVCAHKAINMVEVPPHGYLHPKINNDLCVDCGLCSKTCPANNPPEFNSPLTAFAAISKNHDDLMSSSSGAASSVLATHIIKKGGVVYGSVEEDYTHIAHQRIDSLGDLPKIKGSKYVHSYTTDIFPKVKADLQQGLEVLFLGTPCQIAGLRKYLRKSYDNLTLVDLCCHGVPSQKFLRDDVEHLCDVTFRNKGDMSKPWDRWGLYVTFRNKGDMSKPWDRWGLYVTFRNKGDMSKPWDRYGIYLSGKEKNMIISPFLKDNYITAFMSGLLFRENCYTCPYARAKRVSDITIADFWGYQGKQIKTDDGISLLMPSTKKGMQLIASCQSAFYCEERLAAEAIKGNGQFNHPSSRPKERDTFLRMYSEDMQEAYRIALRDYIKNYKKRILKGKVYKVLKPLAVLKRKVIKK